MDLHGLSRAIIGWEICGNMMGFQMALVLNIACSLWSLLGIAKDQWP